MMLSRVADNLYWMNRYLERAEHTARLLDVTLDLTAERSDEAVTRDWKNLYVSLGKAWPEAPIEARDAVQTWTFQSDNPNAIASCIAAARENARQVREQISSEMWEQVNRLYLAMREADLDVIWEDQPHAFFQDVKQGIHLFQGITDSTMNRGEGWHFIQAGLFIERASNIATLLDVTLPSLSAQSTPSHDAYLDAVGLLRSCTAWEAYCKQYSAEIRLASIVEFLLLHEEFPHSVNFSVMMVRNALDFLAASSDTQKHSPVQRTVGRLKAMLDYGQVDEVLASGLQAFLQQMHHECGEVHRLLYETYIHYPIDEKLPA